MPSSGRPNHHQLCACRLATSSNAVQQGVKLSQPRRLAVLGIGADRSDEVSADMRLHDHNPSTEVRAERIEPLHEMRTWAFLSALPHGRLLLRGVSAAV